jgi:hypothetical protein
MLKVSENPPMLPETVQSLSDLDGDWWVAHTKSRAEKALAWDLLAHGIPYFLPMAEKTMLWGGRRRKVLTAIFPSYVFFCGDREDRYKVLATNRVCQTISVNFREQFISELEAIRQATGSKMEMDLYPFAAVGKRCRVAKGALRGTEGTVISKDGITRLVLAITILGQGASLEIAPEFLEPMD